MHHAVYTRVCECVCVLERKKEKRDGGSNCAYEVISLLLTN